MSHVKEVPPASDEPSPVQLGTFSYLPPLDADELAKQIDYLVERDLEPAIEHIEPGRAKVRYWHLWKLPLFGERSPEAIEAEIHTCRANNPGDHVRLIGYNTRRQTQEVSFVVSRG